MITLPLEEIALLNGNVYRVLFKNTGFSYTAGQYLEILLPDNEPRPFSIANKPGDLLELHIRWLSDSPYLVALIENIKKTNALTIQGPLGHCVYQKIPAYPSILIGGGTGFAPLKAIIEQALSEGLNQPMHLYWGARSEDDLYMNELPKQWAAQEPLFRYTALFDSTPILYSKRLDFWQGAAKESNRSVHRVHEDCELSGNTAKNSSAQSIQDAVLADYPTLTRHHVYACGPFEMVHAVFNALKPYGLEPSLMHSDAFP